MSLHKKKDQLLNAAGLHRETIVVCYKNNMKPVNTLALKQVVGLLFLLF